MRISIRKPIASPSRLGAFVALSSLGICSVATADPLPGETLKFYQSPLNNAGPLYPIGSTPTALDFPASPQFPGHDELSTARLTAANNQYIGTMMADDFADKFTTPIVHVTFWGSYMNGTLPPAGTNGGVQKFQISFYTDNPGSTANSASSPLQPYSSQTVSLINGALTPQSGKFTEKLVPNTTGAPQTLDSPLFQYNAELALPVPEPVPGVIGTVDWISIVALTGPNDPSPNLQWGWHDRDYGIFDPLATSSPLTNPGERNINAAGLPPVWHFQDDAVSNATFSLTPGALPATDPTQYLPQNYIPGIDVPSTYPQPLSKDLAFALYTSVPEPSEIALIALCAGGLLIRSRRAAR